MPNVTVPNKEEKALLAELGMHTKDYGVMQRTANMFGLLCYATRDYLWIKSNSFGTDEPEVRQPDDAEKQILRDNGVDPEHFVVTYRDADSIQLRFIDTDTCVEIWKGDRTW